MISRLDIPNMKLAETNGLINVDHHPNQQNCPHIGINTAANNNATTVTSSSVKSRHYCEEWQMPLFGCFDDVGLCLQTYLCPCVAAGLILEFTDTTTFLTGCCATLLPVIGCFYLCLARTKVRELHHIGGSESRDLGLSCFLAPCVLNQTACEVDVRPAQILNRFWDRMRNTGCWKLVAGNWLLGHWLLGHLFQRH